MELRAVWETIHTFEASQSSCSSSADCGVSITKRVTVAEAICMRQKMASPHKPSMAGSSHSMGKIKMKSIPRNRQITRNLGAFSLRALRNCATICLSVGVLLSAGVAAAQDVHIAIVEQVIDENGQEQMHAMPAAEYMAAAAVPVLASIRPSIAYRPDMPPTMAWRPIRTY